MRQIGKSMVEQVKKRRSRTGGRKHKGVAILK